MKLKRSITAGILILAILLSSTAVLANGDNSRGRFTDVRDDYWAREAIDFMTLYGIINGYDDGKFKPEANVSRAEFAKMMVLTLNLELYAPSTPYFLDVPAKSWYYDEVETARLYMTGWRTTQGIYFRPEAPAVREDMAVAIVKGLGLNTDNADLSVLNGYSDASLISPNLRKYVAVAIKEGIMIGSNNAFDPKSNITRAETATLLARLIQEEKVVFDEDEKVTFEDAQAAASLTPSLTYKIRENDVLLEWTKVPSADFSYYKVVLSKGNLAPKYPDDGYAAAISDVNTIKYELSSGSSYQNGDLGGKIIAGETYYVAITAVYKDGKKTSNVETIKIPGTYVEPDVTSRTPKLTASVTENGVVLNWTKTPESGFNYYKVVLSQTDSTPSYPDNGYVTYITDPSQITFKVQEGQSYNGGNELNYVDDKTYYMAITAVYNDGKYTSNVISATVPDI